MNEENQRTQQQTGAFISAWIIDAKIDGFVAKFAYIKAFNVIFSPRIADALVETRIKAVTVTRPTITAWIFIETASRSHLAIGTTPTIFACTCVTAKRFRLKCRIVQMRHTLNSKN